MAQNEKLVGSAVEKLNFLSSPLSDPKAEKAGAERAGTRVSVIENRDGRHTDEIRLAHNDDATNLEVFYDLFLACLNLFSQNQQLHRLRGLTSYIGFFSIIWTTWFMTTMYDVRFLKDSLFERCARGVHLGVLVGFVVVSPNFQPAEQDHNVFRVFSIILMASRLCLAVEYGSVLYHLRNYKTAIFPLVTLIAKNFAAAMIYLGVAFVFREGHSSDVFIFWYVLAAVEIAGTLYLSVRYRFLSFHGTYIMKRMGLMTCIFFGEGVAVACGNITKVVKVEDHEDVWTSATMGTVTACIAIAYIVFMIYSDWVSKVQLPGWRQLVWTLLHCPLHLVMNLFMEGCSQWIIFWKLAESNNWIISKVNSVAEELNNADFAGILRQFVTATTDRWPAKSELTKRTLENALEAVKGIDIEQVGADLAADLLENPEDEGMNVPDYVTVVQAIVNISLALDNNLYAVYGIDFSDDVLEAEKEGDKGALGLGHTEITIYERNYTRSRVVYQYTFVCAGCFLAIANLISIVSRTKRWTISASIYHGVIFMLALGVGLVAAVSQDEDSLTDYATSPWILPTLLLSCFLILILNHISGWLAASRDEKKSAAAGSADQYPPQQPDSYASSEQYTPMAVESGTVYTEAPKGFSVPRRPVATFESSATFEPNAGYEAYRPHNNTWNNQ